MGLIAVTQTLTKRPRFIHYAQWSRYTARYVHEDAPQPSSPSRVPDIPSRVRGWPTPFVSKEEEPLLQALYLCGWFVRITRHADKAIAHLKKCFNFTSFGQAVQFMNDVAALAGTEKHHPSILSYDCLSAFGVPGKEHEVTFSITTHSAMPSPSWISNLARASGVDVVPSTQNTMAAGNSVSWDRLVEAFSLHISGTSSPSRAIPSITLRDVRFGMLLQQAFEDKYSAASNDDMSIADADNCPSWDTLALHVYHHSILPLSNTQRADYGGALQSQATDPPPDEAPAIERLPPDIQKSLATTRRILAEGSPYPRCVGLGADRGHTGPANAATLNKSGSPRTRCQACGGSHTLFHCLIRSFITPTRSCSLCGKRHWMVDCPKYVGPVSSKKARTTISKP
ncbi:hypothetical protein FISHEDRAFT_76976 [Fistulina hepatica ATCC 64428]|uniref:4a-hydroxytetrahydrobiopterin dehydratase n=1 Tax=Fistulina hepatica ATCC 64428 TaxID=1128425 RepID=A0A0D7A3J4_9AGAR|nr:hypothetical protein FISHEDRAFT_76976 [Fistulina hepatica ATCC 64428]